MEQTARVYGNKITLPFWVKNLRCIYSQGNEKGIYEIVKSILNMDTLLLAYTKLSEAERQKMSYRTFCFIQNRKRILTQMKSQVMAYSTQD